MLYTYHHFTLFDNIFNYATVEKLTRLWKTVYQPPINRAKLNSMKTCPYCGNQIKRRNIFVCEKCEVLSLEEQERRQIRRECRELINEYRQAKREGLV